MSVNRMIPDSPVLAVEPPALTNGTLPLDRLATVAARSLALCKSLGGNSVEITALTLELAAAETALGQDLEAGAMAHRQASRVHAKRRAFERLGMALHERDILQIEFRCQQALGVRPGKAKAWFVRGDKNGRRVFRTFWNGRTLYPVYCPALGCVVSFIPKAWAEGDRKPSKGKAKSNANGWSRRRD